MRGLRSKLQETSRLDRISFHAFWISGAFLIFISGVAVAKYQLLPSRFLSMAHDGKKQLCAKSMSDKGLLWPIDANRPALFNNASKAWEGLNLMTRVDAVGLSANIMDMNGKLLHKWDVDWFKVWPDAGHLPDGRTPQSQPGTHIHGAVVMDNGNLAFNFEGLGLACLDLHGKVLWRLPYLTHHSIVAGDDGNLWVCGQKQHLEPDDRVPNWIPPFIEETILEVSPDGKIVRERSVIDLLLKNGREGLLYLGSIVSVSTSISGDVLHLNDIEPFPSQMEEGFFKKGDVLVSLRNINTILVFNRSDEKIKFVCTGGFVRQHDPDFMDGNTISVFDNHNMAPYGNKPNSRIVVVSAPDQHFETKYEGGPGRPFFTHIMGKHQWLPNGNLLITDACNGRAIEVDEKSEIVWEYVNYTDEGFVGLVEEMTRFRPSKTSVFYNFKSRVSEVARR